MSEPSTRSELVVVKGKHRGDFVRLGAGPVTIGRAATAQLSLSRDSKISSMHARVTPLGGDRWLLEDLQSTNGTFLNDEQVEQSPLRSGDLIRIGRSLLVFRAEGASVHLSDVQLQGGGSSADLRPRSAAGMTLPPPYPAQAAETHKVIAPAAPAAASLPQGALQELLLAGSELVFARRLERVLDSLLRATNAARALLFVRHPLTGGLGAVATRTRVQGDVQEPVNPGLLRRAAEGEVVAEGDQAAAPVRWQGVDLGAIYLARAEQADDPSRIGLLTAAGLQLGSFLGAERARRLAESACEIVGLMAHTPQTRPVDMSTLLNSLDRLFGPGARARGLAWRVEYQPGMIAMADPILLGRGLDTLVEHALSVARVELLVRGAVSDGVMRLWVVRDRSEPPEVTAALLDRDGVPGDLRRMAQALDDGTLAVARVALERAGGRFQIRAEEERAVHALEVSGRTTDRAV